MNITHIITWSTTDTPSSYTDERGQWVTEDWDRPISSVTAQLETIDGNRVDSDGFDCVPGGHPARQELLERLGNHDIEDIAPYQAVENRILAKHGLDRANVVVEAD